MKELKAFTLMEMLIVLIISGIVISIGYGAYSFMGEQLGSFRTLTKDDESVNAGISMLEYEVFKGNEIRRINNNEIIIEGESGIRYRIEGIGLIRYTGELIDTFLMQIKNPELTFENSIVTSDSGLIDKIRFNILSDQETTLPVTIHKEYDAFRLLENAEVIKEHEQY